MICRLCACVGFDVFLSVFQKEGVQKAKALVSKGQKMMEDTHYAVEAIRHRCKELEKLCDDFEKAVQKREENLKKAMDIHQCLEQVQFTSINAWSRYSLLCGRRNDFLTKRPSSVMQIFGGKPSIKEGYLPLWC